MVGIVSFGGADQLLTLQGAVSFELFVRQDRFPFLRVIRDGVPDLGQNGRLGVPNAAAAKNLSRLQMDVVTRRVDIFSGGRAEMGRGRGFVGGLVLGKAGVP